MKKFLEDLEQELKKLKVNKAEIAEILADHKEMIEEAKKEGLSEEELEVKFGDPKKVAGELFRDSLRETYQDDVIQDGELEGYSLFKSFEAIDGVTEVDIKLVSEDLVYLPNDTNTIEVYVKRMKHEEDYQVEYNEGVFTLHRVSQKSIRLFGNNNSPDFAVRVPKSELKRFNLSVVSGDFEVNQVTCVDFLVKSTSGDGELSRISVTEDLKINTVSGDLEIENATANNLEITTVSGDVEFKNVGVANEIHGNSVSGDVEAENVTGEFLNFRTVSGDFEGKEVYVKKVQVKSVSGDFDIKNSTHDQEIAINKKTVSGDVTIK